ncbi:hypothetical protein [Roseobacter sp. EG26]
MTFLVSASRINICLCYHMVANSFSADDLLALILSEKPDFKNRYFIEMR